MGRRAYADFPGTAAVVYFRIDYITCAPVQTFWHSSSHVLGEALEAEFGAELTIGPALEEGFYYDCYLGDRVLGDADKPRLQKRIEKVSEQRWRKDRDCGDCFLTGWVLGDADEPPRRSA